MEGGANLERGPELVRRRAMTKTIADRGLESGRRGDAAGRSPRKDDQEEPPHEHVATYHVDRAASALELC
jgi:hypothetical protein